MGGRKDPRADGGRSGDALVPVRWALCYASRMRRLVLPPSMRSLSARLLVLTIAFVMVGEVLIFVPSIARFRMTWFEDKIAAGRLAVLALEATPDNMVSQPLADQLL